MHLPEYSNQVKRLHLIHLVISLFQNDLIKTKSINISVLLPFIMNKLSKMVPSWEPCDVAIILIPDDQEKDENEDEEGTGKTSSGKPAESEEVR